MRSVMECKLRERTSSATGAPIEEWRNEGERSDADVYRSCGAILRWYVMIMIMIQWTKLPGLRKRAFLYAKIKEQDKKTHKIKHNHEVANSGRRTPAARELSGDQIYLKFGNFVRFLATNDLPIPCVEGICVCLMRGLPTRAHCRSSSPCAGHISLGASRFWTGWGRERSPWPGERKATTICWGTARCPRGTGNYTRYARTSTHRPVPFRGRDSKRTHMCSLANTRARTEVEISQQLRGMLIMS